MWEEEPRYQNAVYRFLIGGVITLTVIAVGVPVFLGEWWLLGQWLLGLGVFGAALCLYAAVVWLAGHAVRWAAGRMRRVFHRSRHDG